MSDPVFSPCDPLAGPNSQSKPSNSPLQHVFFLDPHPQNGVVSLGASHSPPGGNTVVGWSYAHYALVLWVDGLILCPKMAVLLSVSGALRHIIEAASEFSLLFEVEDGPKKDIKTCDMPCLKQLM